MKTWEMIKELTENPEKKFRNRNDYELIAGIDEDLGVINYEYNGEYLYFSPYDEWEEVKEPVSFIEAVESGKRVKVEYMYINDPNYKYIDLEEYEEFDPLDILFSKLACDFSSVLIRDIIKNGEWYIEEE